MRVVDYIGWVFVIIAFLAIAFMIIDVYLDERDNERLLSVFKMKESPIL